MKLLSEADVRHLFDPQRAIKLSSDAFRTLSDGSAEIPVRTDILKPEIDGVLMVMPGYVDDRVFGLKINASRRMPVDGRMHTSSMVMVFSVESFEPVGLMSSDFFTDYRTAAGLAAASDVLAAKSARVHVVFGAGKLARPSIEMISYVRDIERVIIVGRTQANVESLADSLRADARFKGVVIETGLPADKAVEVADIITAVTTSRTPLCDGSRIKPGTHINLGGAFHPEWREMDDHVAAKGNFYADSMKSCLARAGDIIIPLNSGVLERSRLKGEIGQVLLGEIPARQSENQITVFKSLGNAAQDLVLAADLLGSAPAGKGLDFDHG